MNRTRRLVLRSFAVSLGALLISVTGCSKPADPAAKPEQKAQETPQEKEVVVFAAASLRDAFTAMGEEFERAHPGIQITFNFAGTQELRTQLEHGAAVDVFASADQKHMDALVQANHAAAPVVFVRNEPVIVVAREAASTIKSLADLPNAARVVIGTPEVPIGHYTLQILDRAAATLGPDFRTKVESKVASRELNVKQVLTKVSLGEADVGVVYRTDAQGKADVTVVSIPADINVIAEYPIAVVTGAAHPVLAKAWVDFVLSDAGQKTLQGGGFMAPSAGR